MLPEKEENLIIYKAPSPGGPVEKGASGITIFPGHFSFFF